MESAQIAYQFRSKKFVLLGREEFFGLPLSSQLHTKLFLIICFCLGLSFLLGRPSILLKQSRIQKWEAQVKCQRKQKGSGGNSAFPFLRLIFLTLCIYQLDEIRNPET